MSATLPPVGAIVRVTDVLEGPVTKHFPHEAAFEIDGGYYVATMGADAPWKRTVEVLELPRPDEPTGVNAVVLARDTSWTTPNVSREVWVRVGDKWAWQGLEVGWDRLADVSVLHPGGVE